MYVPKGSSFTIAYLIVLALVILLLCSLAGCQDWAVRPRLNGIIEPVPSTGPVDALLETITALTIANTASSPVNPYATPIGVGLAGVIAMLEALRRKEKAARKFAEQNNHVQDKT